MRLHEPFCPWVSDFFSRGSIFLWVTDLPKMKLAPGNFHGYVKKNKGIAHDSSRCKTTRPQGGSTNHKIGERKEASCCDELCKQHGWLLRNDVSIVHVSICIVDYTLL